MKQAKEPGTQIYLVDEASVRSHFHQGLTWGKKDETPEVINSGGQFGLSLISGVTRRGDMKFGFIEGKMNAKRFIAFLKQRQSDAGQPVIVISKVANCWQRYDEEKFVIHFTAHSKMQIIG